MISEHVVEVLGLIPLGRALVSGFHGMAHLRTYGVSISLGKGLAFANMEVVAAKVITDEHHVLLGMDIISQLDFAITNASEQTIHSIQYPSSAKIDFQQMGID